MLVIVLLAILPFSLGDRCQHPPPAPNYQNSLYQGRWYEIGKIQTPGGASFQEGTVCTIATYNPDEAEVGGGAIGYSSRKETTTGDYVNATGTLTQLDAPGHFKQQLYFFGIPGPSVDYNVIYIDDEVAVEYDCNDKGLGLNTDNIAYLAGDQDGCW
eukprot:11947.XXX_342027_340409_1 [CDS] Oithona nana genome sequencing.